MSWSISCSMSVKPQQQQQQDKIDICSKRQCQNCSQKKEKKMHWTASGWSVVVCPSLSGPAANGIGWGGIKSAEGFRFKLTLTYKVDTVRCHSLFFMFILSYWVLFHIIPNFNDTSTTTPSHSISSTPGSCSRSVGSAEASKEASGVSVWEYVPCSTGGPKPNSNPMSGMAAISSPDPSLLILTRCSVRAARTGRWTGRASRDSRKADKICRSSTRKRCVSVTSTVYCNHICNYRKNMVHNVHI